MARFFGGQILIMQQHAKPRYRVLSDGSGRLPPITEAQSRILEP
jgi:hypothetical protein